MWEILVGWFVLSCVLSPIIGLALKRLESAPRVEEGAIDSHTSRMPATENKRSATPNVEIGAWQVAQDCS